MEILDARTIGRVHGAEDNTYTAGVICAKVARYAERALRLIPEERLVLATTTSLEYLPRDVARAKLAALVQGARLVTGEKVVA